MKGELQHFFLCLDSNRSRCDFPHIFSFRIEGVRLMTQWKCSNCGYTFGANTVPERCPSCKQTCTFSDVTCYIPDCGGPDNLDPRLVGKKDKPVNE